jgi:hypothetical protein
MSDCGLILETDLSFSRNQLSKQMTTVACPDSPEGFPHIRHEAMFSAL